MKARYKSFRFRPATLDMLDTINNILHEYAEQDLKLTVRQLFYQLVARGLIENSLKSYKNVASLLNDGRLGGYIDWDMIEDRTREFKGPTRWLSGAQILRASSNSFHMDMWENQDHRVFVIIEKEALFGVFERVCREYDVPLLAARGYPSVSVLREFVMEQVAPCNQAVTILHFGDHDPSGIDMTRDLEDRIKLFNETERGPAVDLRRIALNMDQVNELRPPENPAKITDTRAKAYIRQFGRSSWELDALEPRYLVNLIQQEVLPLIDDERWARRQEEVEDIKLRIRKAASTFE